MRVLIACECSGAVRRAFRALGHDAWSCDLQPAEDGSPWHIQGDALKAIAAGCPTDGLPWDLVIAHPPCDFLTVSGNRWFKDGAKAGPGVLVGAARRAAQLDALRFVRAIWESPVGGVAIENPVGRLSTLWRKPTQIIQPTQFGEPHRKGTCLWLRGLPPLQPTHVPGGDLFCPAEPAGVQSVWLMAPSKTRKTDRSRTYAGIAQAMAEQWGGPNSATA